MKGVAVSLVRRARLLLAWALLFAAGGCMPLVTHGPRVEEGLWTGSTGSFRLGSLPEGEVDTPLGSFALRPPNGFFARYGWLRGEEGPTAVLVGAHLPFAIPFSIVQPEVDVYAQLTPAAAQHAGGAGVLVSPAHLMPYVQAGSNVGERNSWYTTQGVAVIGFAGGAPRALLWSPALSWRRGRLEQTALHRRRFATHYFLQAGFGREWVPQDGGGDRIRTLRFLLIGVTTEASGRPSIPRVVPGL